MGNNEQYATRLQRGRVFCAGDAVHKHPPSNGLGSNTSIQDSYNLAWKIAATLSGQAGAALLDTYSDERAPVAKQIVLRANQSSREFVQLFSALGIEPGQTEAEMIAQIEERKDNSPAGAAKRGALLDAMALKDYEFNAHGVELGQFYQSSAVLSDGTFRPVPERDPELYYQPSTVPGSRLPHVWVGDAQRTVSTHDLAPYGRFTVFTGITGTAWVEAAAVVAQRWGVPLGGVVIGPGQDVTDLYYDWARLREVAEDGMILVRPDKHIGWRSHAMADDPTAVWSSALTSILGRV